MGSDMKNNRFAIPSPKNIFNPDVYAALFSYSKFKERNPYNSDLEVIDISNMLYIQTKKPARYANLSGRPRRSRENLRKPWIQMVSGEVCVATLGCLTHHRKGKVKEEHIHLYETPMSPFFACLLVCESGS